jgi:nucleoside phosphorylase
LSAAPAAVVAALEEELAPLRRRSCGRALLVAAGGMGYRRAEAAADSLLAAHRPRLLVGIGLAGALSPNLSPGELLVGRHARHPDGTWEAADAAWSMQAASVARIGVLCTHSRMLLTAAERARVYASLGGDGAAAVDLESAAWLRAAARRGVPAIVLRAISEASDEDLPEFLADGERADGSLSRTRIVRAALPSPRRWRALLALRQRTRICAERLAAALAMLLS